MDHAFLVRAMEAAACPLRVLEFAVKGLGEPETTKGVSRRNFSVFLVGAFPVAPIVARRLSKGGRVGLNAHECC